MVLVDTSVWVSHLRKDHPHLKQLLLEENVNCHPLIIGELACGDFRNRDEILSLLTTLPQTKIVEHSEILHFIESKKLMGKGLGLIDMHLLASALITNVPLWTEDKALLAAAGSLNLLYRG